MDNVNTTALIVAFIGSLTSLFCVWITMTKETKRQFLLKRHEVLSEAAKVIEYRAILYQRMLQLTNGILTEQNIQFRIESILLLWFELSKQLSLDRTIVGILPYVVDIPRIDYDELKDFDIMSEFARHLMEIHDRILSTKGSTLLPNEYTQLKNDCKLIQDPFRHEYERARKTADYLYIELRRNDSVCLLDNCILKKFLLKFSLNDT